MSLNLACVIKFCMFKFLKLCLICIIFSFECTCECTSYLSLFCEASFHGLVLCIVLVSQSQAHVVIVRNIKLADISRRLIIDVVICVQQGFISIFALSVCRLHWFYPNDANIVFSHDHVGFRVHGAGYLNKVCPTFRLIGMTCSSWMISSQLKLFPLHFKTDKNDKQNEPSSVVPEKIDRISKCMKTSANGYTHAITDCAKPQIANKSIAMVKVHVSSHEKGKRSI